MIIAIVGPPACGKSTIAVILRNRFRKEGSIHLVARYNHLFSFILSYLASGRSKYISLGISPLAIMDRYKLNKLFTVWFVVEALSQVVMYMLIRLLNIFIKIVIVEDAFIDGIVDYAVLKKHLPNARHGIVSRLIMLTYILFLKLRPRMVIYVYTDYVTALKRQLSRKRIASYVGEWYHQMHHRLIRIISVINAGKFVEIYT